MEKKIAELIYAKLKQKKHGDAFSLLSKELSKEKTGKIGITKTPLLVSTGKELGKLLLNEDWKFEELRNLWKLSLSEKENLAQGLAGGREARLIIIGALSMISKKEYGETKRFVSEISESIADWETCDQLALRVIINLAIKNRDELFSVMKAWSEHENKWIRRLAAATIVPYIRARKQEARTCLKLLNNMMEEEDKEVKKAIAWALREITKKDADAVSEFLHEWAKVNNRNTRWIIREGMKKLSSEEQDRLNALIAE